MSYYQFNWQEILQKANNGYCKKKKKGAEYHLQKIKKQEKESQRINIKTLLKKKKIRLKSIKEKDISN